MLRHIPKPPGLCLTVRSKWGPVHEGKLYLFVAIDRTSKFAFTWLVKKAGKMAAAQFLRDLIAAVPYRLHTVLTDNGVQFTNRKTDAHAAPPEADP
jgi:transposase-like protein